MAFERNGTCRDGVACKYAHGKSELQVNTKQASVSNSSSTVHLVPVPVAVQVVMLNAVPSESAANPTAQTVVFQPVQVVGVLPQSANFFNIPPSKHEGMMKQQREEDTWSVQTTDEDLDSELESLPSSSRQTSEWPSISEDDSNEHSSVESDSRSQCQSTSDARSEASEDVAFSAKQRVSEEILKEIPKVPNAFLRKTKMCKFFMQGGCARGSKCNFSHEKSTLKARPNLCRTSLCMAFERTGKCKLGDECNYAHGTDQIVRVPADDSKDAKARECQTASNPDAAKAQDSFKQSLLRSTFMTHEASGVVVSTKNTFLHLRPDVRKTRRRSASC
jgi:hypothetical protein